MAHRERESQKKKPTLFSLLVINKEGRINPVTIPAAIGFIITKSLHTGYNFFENLIIWAVASWLFGLAICYPILYFLFGKPISKILKKQEKKRYHREVEVPTNNFKSKYPILFDNSHDSMAKIISDYRRLLPYGISEFRLDECLKLLHKSFTKYNATSIE